MERVFFAEKADRLFVKQEKLDKEFSVTSPPRFSKARLWNEYLTSRYLSQNTTIRIPKAHYAKITDGVMECAFDFVSGILLDDIKEDRDTALSNAKAYIDSELLPQLKELKSTVMGSLLGIIIPPRFVIDRSYETSWPAHNSEGKIYTFCHNDLAQHNIMMDPKTLQVLAIIDWEYAGFYPEGFEVHLYQRSSMDDDYFELSEEKLEQMEQMLKST